MIKSLSLALAGADLAALQDQAAAKGTTLEAHCAEILTIEAAILHDGPRDLAAARDRAQACADTVARFPRIQPAAMPLTPPPASPRRSLGLLCAVGFYVLAGVGAGVTVDRVAGERGGLGLSLAAGALWPVMLGAAAVQVGALR